MYCRPPLVKSMSRSSLGGQTQSYSGTADEEDDRTSSAAAPAQPRRDSESKLAYSVFINCACAKANCANLNRGQF